MKNSSADYHPLESTNCLQLNVLIEPQQSYGYFHKIIVLMNIIMPAGYKNNSECQQDPSKASIPFFALQDYINLEDFKMDVNQILPPNTHTQKLENRNIQGNKCIFGCKYSIMYCCEIRQKGKDLKSTGLPWGTEGTTHICTSTPVRSHWHHRFPNPWPLTLTLGTQTHLLVKERYDIKALG